MEKVGMKKKAAGRPRQAVKKEAQVCARYTRAEYFVVQEKASRFGMNISEYIRQASLSGRVKARLTEEEREMARQLVGMANNLNQLIKACHEESLLQAMIYFESYRNRLDEILRKLKP